MLRSSSLSDDSLLAIAWPELSCDCVGPASVGLPVTAPDAMLKRCASLMTGSSGKEIT
jgi:hypothetical protein